MIDEKFLRDLAVKSATKFTNIAREYLQNLFLSGFYSQKGSGHFLFKGGTALRIVFGSPRFSEDLDFSGIKNSVGYETLLEATLLELSRQPINIELVESKPTSGGYISIISAKIYGEKIEIQNQISFRPKPLKSELVTINSNLVPAYSITLLDQKLLVAEKVQALLTRAKPRDYYDFYFLLRAGLIQNKNKQVLAKVKEKLKTDIDFKKELQGFLPKSHWPLIKTLPAAIGRELARFR